MAEEAQRKLFRSARVGDASGVDAAVQRGALVDAVEDGRGRSALHVAAASGHLDVVKLLLYFRAEPNTRSGMDSDQGATALHLAAEAGHTEVAEALLAASADKDATTNKGWTALHMAAYKGHREIMEMLKGLGCNLDARSDTQATALHFAAAGGHRQVVQWLVQSGAKCDLKDRGGRLPVDVAKKHRHKDITEYLKKHTTKNKSFRSMLPFRGSKNKKTEDEASSLTSAVATTRDPARGSTRQESIATTRDPVRGSTRHGSVATAIALSGPTRQGSERRRDRPGSEVRERRSSVSSLKTKNAALNETHPSSPTKSQAATTKEPEAAYPNLKALTEGEGGSWDGESAVTPTAPQEAPTVAPTPAPRTIAPQPRTLPGAARTLYPQASLRGSKNKGWFNSAPRMGKKDLKMQVENLQRELQHKENELAGLTEELQQMAHEKSQSQETTALEQRLSTMQQHQQYLSSQHQQAIYNMQHQIQQLSNENQEFYQSLQQAERQVVDLSTASRDQDRIIETHEETVAEQERTIAAREASVAELMQQLERSRQYEALYRNQLNDGHEDELRRELATYSSTITQLTMEVERLKKESSTSSEQLKQATRTQKQLQQQAILDKGTIQSLYEKVDSLTRGLKQPQAAAPLNTVVAAEHGLYGALRTTEDTQRTDSGREWLADDDRDQETVTRLRREVEDLTQWLQQEQAKLQLKQKEHHEKEAESAAVIADLRRQLGDGRSSNPFLKQAFQELQAKEESHMAVIAGLQEQLQQEKKKKTNDALEWQLQEMKKKDSDNLMVIAGLQEQLKQEKNKKTNDALEWQLQEMKKKDSDNLLLIAGLQEQLQQEKHSDESKKLSQQLQEIEKQKNKEIEALKLELEKTTEKQEQIYQEQQARCERLQQEQTTTKEKQQQLQEAERRNRQLEEKLWAKDQQITLLNKDLQQKEKQIQNLTFKARQLKEELETAAEWVGLPNLGNTCYMNSVLHCLFNIDQLRQYFTSRSQRSEKNAGSEGGGSVVEAVTQVFLALSRDNNVQQSAQRFKEVAGQYDEEFRQNMQRDAHDLLSSLLTWLHDDLYKAEIEKAERRKGTWPQDETSVISRLFHGEHKSTITCEVWDKVVCDSTESFSSLTLALTSPTTVSLQELLRKHYQRQQIEWDCQYCGRPHRCLHQTTISRLPSLLIIHFSRYHKNSSHAKKTQVDFPASDFSLRDFAVPSCSRERYELVATVNHHGTMTAGHYTAACRTAGVPRTRWLAYDDDHVCPTFEDAVLRQPDVHILLYSVMGR